MLTVSRSLLRSTSRPPHDRATGARAMEGALVRHLRLEVKGGIWGFRS
ncbi:hypothetical protein KCP73_00845 [Salmonella enterica subsp. enterica]|nr:hypothetical protein KCP73_00845 [Salmonella enterica subsp. enterica]